MSGGDRILLRGLRFHAYLGPTAAESARSQPVELDLEMDLPLAEAGRTDDLARTLDYAAVFHAVQGVVEGQRFQLLEAIAERAAQAAKRCGAGPVVVRARKFRPPVGGHLEVAEVELRRP